jgi:hypothetical protein
MMAGRPLTDPMVLGDVTFLIGFCLIMIPIGLWLMRKGLERMRREGYSPQPRISRAGMFG